MHRRDITERAGYVPPVYGVNAKRQKTKKKKNRNPEFIYESNVKTWKREKKIIERNNSLTIRLYCV